MISNFSSNNNGINLSVDNIPCPPLCPKNISYLPVEILANIVSEFMPVDAAWEARGTCTAFYSAFKESAHQTRLTKAAESIRELISKAINKKSIFEEIAAQYVSQHFAADFLQSSFKVRGVISVGFGAEGNHVAVADNPNAAENDLYVVYNLSIAQEKFKEIIDNDPEAGKILLDLTTLKNRMALADNILSSASATDLEVYKANGESLFCDKEISSQYPKLLDKVFMQAAKEGELSIRGFVNSLVWPDDANNGQTLEEQIMPNQTPKEREFIKCVFRQPELSSIKFEDITEAQSSEESR